MKYSMFYLARRGPTISAEAFPARWLAHRALMRNASFTVDPGFTSGVYLLVDQDAHDGAQGAPFDGICLSTLNDLDQFDLSATQNPDFIRSMKADEEIAFGGNIDPMTAIGPRETIVEGERTEHALIMLRSAKDGVDAIAFADGWKSHLRQLLALPEFDAAQNVVLTSVTRPAPSPEHRCDLMTELWFPGREAMRAAGQALRLLAATEGEVALANLARSHDAQTSILRRPRT